MRRHPTCIEGLYQAERPACAGVLSLPADEAPLFVPVVTELRSAGPGTEAAARSSTTISIEIGGGSWIGSAALRQLQRVSAAARRG